MSAHFRRFLAASLTLLLALLAAPAGAACSAYQGRVVINEYNYLDNYIELKVLDPTVLAATANLADWSLTLKINNGGGRTTTKNVGTIIGDVSQNTCAATTATYIRIPFSSNQMENDATALLKDADGNEVDLFRMRQTGSSFPSLTTTCSSWPYDTTLDPDISSSGPKDVARYADGTGNWAVSPGTGNNSFETLCTTNNNVAKLTKTVNVAEAAPGSLVVYTVSLTNNTGADVVRVPFFDSPITVADPLPAGVTFAGATLTTPGGGLVCEVLNLFSGYNSTTGSWSSYCLPDGATQKLTVNAYVAASACPGSSVTNTAQLTGGLSIPGGATLPPVSASFNLVCSGGAQGFNAVESGVLTPDAAVATGRLYTKLVGSAFVFDVVALTADGLRETNFGANNVVAEVVDASSGSCATYAALSPAKSQTLVFTVGDQGRKTAASVTIDRAYRKLGVRMTSDGVTACSSDFFSVRPVALSVINGSATADATGTSTTAVPKIAAGSAFTLQAVGGAGYDGTPAINTTSSRWQAHGATAVNVVPSGTFGVADAATGTAVGNAFTYNDVGYFRLAGEVGAVEDTTFTAIDQSADCTDDYSNELVNGKYGCKIGNIVPSDYFGRFVPHHFAVVPAAMLTPRADIAACSASTFTYLGEPLKVGFELQAQHAGNSVTKKYEGTFARLDPTQPTALGFAAVSGASELTGQLDFTCTGCGSSGTWSEGVAGIMATLTLKRPTALPLPNYAAAASQAVNFGLRPDDGDIDHALAVYDAEMAAATAGNDHLLLKTNATTALAADYLFGRLRLGTAYGSELLPLTVPVEAQVWNGTAFVTAADSCTPLAAANVAFDPAATSVTSVTALSSGSGSITLAAPSPAQRTTVRVCVDLGSTPTGNGADDTTCTATTPAALRYLGGPWDGTAGFYDRDPSARAGFGLNRAPYIYYRAR